MRQRLSISYLAVILAVLTLFLLMPLVVNSKGISAMTTALPKQTEEAYLDSIASDAKVLVTSYGLKPSLVIGQLALASDFGRNVLATRYQNPLALTAEDGQDSVTLRSPIYQDGKWLETTQTFAVYPTWQDNVSDYLARLKGGQAWDKELYKTILASKDEKAAAKALQKANFSSDPDYAKKLAELIETYKLTKYDQ